MERTPKIAVVDASVAVKWFVQEEGSAQAIRMVEGYRDRKVDLRSTRILPFEVLNALRYNPEMGRSEVERAGDALLRFKIALYPILGDLEELCLKTAYDCGLSVYDSSYVSLGEYLGCEVYTADVKLINKVASKTFVKNISEYS